jgi:putative hemolysin
MSLRITDHALVRFMERAGGLDTDALRLALAASLRRAEAAAAEINARRYTVIVDGLRYVIEDGSLITVLDADMRLGRLHRPAGTEVER